MCLCYCICAPCLIHRLVWTKLLTGCNQSVCMYNKIRSLAGCNQTNPSMYVHGKIRRIYRPRRRARRHGSRMSRCHCSTGGGGDLHAAASDEALKMPFGVLPCRGVHVPFACSETVRHTVSSLSVILLEAFVQLASRGGITLQADMLPQPQTRPPLALSVASAAPPRSLLCTRSRSTSQKVQS